MIRMSPNRKKRTKVPGRDPLADEVEIEIGVVNPRYEGATFEMVVKAMLQRPRKMPDQDDDEPTDDGAHSPT